MDREYKSIPLFSVKAEGRTRTGIAAVFGNVDDGGDRLHQGAFTKTIQEGAIRHKHLWGHDWSRPPIASIKDLREVTRVELPDEVLTYAPDATGGLLVSRDYFNSELSDLVLQCIDAGDMEMSIGYAPKQTEFTDAADGSKIRELKEVQLLETSDVPFGMNPATVAAFAKALQTLRPLGAIAQELQIALHNIKAGARNSTQDFAIIEQIHKNLLDLGYNKCSMATIDEESSAIQNDNAKSGEAESVTIADNSLLANELKLNELRLILPKLGVYNHVSICSETG